MTQQPDSSTPPPQPTPNPQPWGTPGSQPNQQPHQQAHPQPYPQQPYPHQGYVQPGYQQPTGYHPNPQAGAVMAAGEERTWAMLSHLFPVVGTLFSGGILGFVGALIVYLIYKDRSAFVRENSANSLNIEIMTFIGAMASFLLMFIFIGFITLPIVLIANLVYHIMGAVKANQGQVWDPPLVPKMIK